MQRFLLPLFLMTMAGLIGLFIIMPEYETIRRLQAEELALEADIASAEKIGTKVDLLKKQYAAFPEGGEEKLHVLLPEKIDMVRYIVDVNAIVTKSGLTMDSPVVKSNSEKKPASEETGPVLGESAISFSVHASYSDFLRLLGNLEKSLALRDITTITFTANDVSGGFALVNKAGQPLRTYEITLKTHTYTP